MFEGVRRWWKGVVGRMFGYTEMKRIAGTDVTMSQAMITAINRWKNMINGNAEWLDSDNGIISLRSEVASAVNSLILRSGKWKQRLIIMIF